jgi:hypothetical protein
MTTRSTPGYGDGDGVLNNVITNELFPTRVS